MYIHDIESLTSALYSTYLTARNQIQAKVAPTDGPVLPSPHCRNRTTANVETPQVFL